MPRLRSQQNSFAGGEISPLMVGRTDFDKYQNSVALLENFLPIPQGGITRRVGTSWAAKTLDGTAVTRLLPFQFSDVQSYVLELGHLYFRAYRNSSRVKYADVGVEDATDATGKIRIQSTAHGYTTGMYVRIESVGGVPLATGDWQVTVIDPNLFDLDGSTFAGAYTSGGTSERILHVTTPYTTAQLFDLKFAQSADILFMAHPSHKPREITRTSDLAWTVTNYAPTGDPFTSVDNYPRAVALWKNRIWWGGTNTDPQKVWGSHADDFQDVTLGTALDNEGIQITIASGNVNVIEWLKARSKNLVIGTIGDEFTLRGNTAGLVTPTNVNVTPETSYGVSSVAPVNIAETTLFLQRSGRKIRQFVFDFNTDGFLGPDLTVLAEHITVGGITQMDYQQELDSTLWLVRADGTLLSFTFIKEQNVLGWARHTSGQAETDAFESVAVIPHPDGDRDQVWVSVKRTVNSVVTRFVEYFEPKLGFYAGYTLDSSLDGTFSAPGVLTVSGLEHLANEVVSIVGDGAIYPNATVNNIGVVTLDGPAAEQIEVGLNYISHCETLRPEPEQTVQGRKTSLAEVVVRLHNTLGLEVNTQGNTAVQVPFRLASDLMDAPPPLFTGDLRFPNLGWGEDAGKLTIRQTQPLPCTVLMVVADIEVGEIG